MTTIKPEYRFLKINRRIANILQTALLFYFIISGFTYARAQTQTNQNTQAVTIDGLFVLVTPFEADDNISMPILISDVELVARLLMIRKLGSKWDLQPVNKVVLFKARRLAALSKIMAHASLMLGETIKVTDKQHMIMKFETRAGGKKQITKLLNQCGASREDFEYWINNFMLADLHISYLKEQASMQNSQIMDMDSNSKDNPGTDLTRGLSTIISGSKIMFPK
jgi:hypothetical protein